MTAKISVGPINSGFKNNRTAFVIDNDSFPTLINAYQWRGRILRKRGTALLTRLRRFFNSLNPSYGSVTTVVLDGSGIANILTGFSLQANGNIFPGSVTITIGGNVYTDPTMDGYLTPTGTGGLNTIVYSTGVITIPGEAGNAASVTFNYYPDLPVMGIADFVFNTDQFPGTIAFDTVYAYNVVTAFPYPSYDVSFYKNPAVSALLPLYVPKTNETAVTWNGKDYQQFWTVNYQGALWATNGINVPFTTTNIGMQFKPITVVTVVTPQVADLAIAAHGLVVGDFIFVNEVVTTTGINFQTGYVIDASNPNLVRVVFPRAIIATNGTGGIAQYLTSRSDITKDNIRFYDGDPTNGNIDNPSLTGNKGWVNFMPPLSQNNFSIGGLPAAIYYLVGARMIVPFKDRLVFVGVVVQTSTGLPIYLQDTVVYSQNGTAYYTASFNGDPRFPNTAVLPIIPILVPDNQTAFPSAYFCDSTGFGGFITAGIQEPILTTSQNEDVLIMGTTTTQMRFVYTGNDIIPFNFYNINSELGSSSTFSAINLDKGVITRGNRGYIIASQTEVVRIDMDIPDQVFEVRLLDNGPERICAQRDYINEWMYFTYPSNQSKLSAYKFPNQTLQYNYRDNTWAVFNETYTTYGSFRKVDGYTWQTVGLRYSSWNRWNSPWNSGSNTLLQPEVVGGNQQGFLMIRDEGTNEETSLYIQSFSGSVVTSPNHGLNLGDFLIISGCLGTISAEVNGKIFSVANPTQNTFQLNPTIGTGTYFGGGLITRMYIPFIQTKQFPSAWGDARKTRIGVQRYLFTKTANSQITLLIYLSQDNDAPYNDGPIIPSLNSQNDSLIYSTILYTCPESTNIGLTPANINLETPTASSQQQLWHRINTSLIGDTVQIGFTLSNDQMKSLTPIGSAIAITGISQANPAVILTTANYRVNQVVMISGVNGMTQINFSPISNNYYQVIAANSSSITLDVDSSAFDAYTSGGIVTAVSPINQFAEIELHAFILDVSQSQMLV